MLRAAITRAPLIVVSGPSGIGKTALVLETLHTDFTSRIAKTLHIRLSGKDEPGLHVELLRGVARVAGRRASDWRSVASDREAAIATLIELADCHQYWLVLDDAHRASVEQLQALLPLLARYSRTSRWIVVGRVSPRLDDELAPQALTVGRMSDADLRQLARTWAPDAHVDVVSSMAHAAGGSPWKLRRSIFSGTPDGADLPAEARALLRTFCILECPLSDALLREISDGDPTERLGVLEARGLIEYASSGWRIHEAAAGELDSHDRHAMGETKEALALVLGRSTNPLAGLEALRLLLELRRIDRVVALLERTGLSLISQGHASELRNLLVSDRSEALDRWRARVAIELGDMGLLAEQRAPRSAATSDHLDWARVLLARGEASAAAAIGEELGRDPACSAEEAQDVELLRAEALLAMAEYHAALRLLEAASDCDDVHREARRLELLVDALLALGELDGAHHAARCLEALPLAEKDRLPVARATAETTWRLGTLRGALMIADRPSLTAPGALARDAARRLLCLQVHLTLHRGQLETSDTLLRRLLPYARSARGSALDIQLLEAERKLHAGELEGLEVQLRELAAVVTGQPERSSASLGFHTLQNRLAILQARPLHRSRTPLSTASSIAEQRLAVAELERLVRTGREVDAPVDAAGLACEVPVLLTIVHAYEHLLAGRPDRATASADTAVREAALRGDVLAESEARRTLCDVLVATSDVAQLSKQVDALQQLYEQFPSERLARDVAAYRLVSNPERPDPMRMEALAACEPFSSTASRRARALLGETVALDAVDELVLNATRQRFSGWEVETMMCCAVDSELPEPASWGLDCDRRSVWIADGTDIVLQHSPVLWRVLETLALHEGRATKEELIAEAWGEPYHPLRHDNRLRLAIRKLRKLLESDPTNPTRLITVADGYALLGTVRRSRSVPPAART